MTKNLKNKKIAVLGLGVEGLSSARFLQEKGVSVWLLDKKEKEDIDQEFLSTAEAIGCQFTFGENYLENLSQFEVIVRSPGVKRSLPELVAAEKAGVVITSQTKLFFDLCPGQIIGVTGTKGKGTTATLIFEMLKVLGRDVYLGGNIGTPPFEFLSQLTDQSWVVLELSSFQLQDLDKSPHIAVMLMVTSDHLDHHGSLEEYVEAKRNILRHQTPEDFAILNRDYPASNESDIHTEGKLFFVTRERTTTDQGVFIKENALWMSMQGQEWKIIDTDNIALVGKHNWENAAAAAMAATLAGAAKEDIVQVLRTFTGLKHRLEFVRDVNGVRYYDDSFATTPESVIAAIEAFTEPKVLILGGSVKDSDFTELAKVIHASGSIRAIIGIGDEWERIKSALKTENVKQSILLIEGASTMQQVVQAAAKITEPGDVVLLSPGCASFDMFANYKDRGEQFEKEVLLLA